MKVLKFSQIRIDGGTQMRVSINQDKVAEYADKMREDAVFPPIKVMFDGTVYWLYDGFHRYFAAQSAGFNAIQVEYKPGTMEDAQDYALGANDDHGLPRSIEDKRKSVETALEMERHKDKSDREIAKLCKVSASFVGSIRRPEVKERQKKNLAKHIEKTTKQEEPVVNYTDDAEPKPVLTQDYGPDEAELKANELAEQADRETFNKMLESDDKLATAYEEIKRLQFLNAQMEIRIAALMTEKNEAIKDAKRAQAQLDKIKKAQK
jgi:ParB-like chromosome segregation protein Spo0J